MHTTADKIHVPPEQYLKHQRLFGMFIQGGRQLNAQTKYDWNVFCIQSLKVDIPSKWRLVSEKLIQKHRRKKAQLSIVDRPVSNPRFKCSFNVGMSLTIRALELHGVNTDIIDRTRNLLYEQQASIDAQKPQVRPKHHIFSQENTKCLSRRLLWDLPSTGVAHRREPRDSLLGTHDDEMVGLVCECPTLSRRNYKTR